MSWRQRRFVAGAQLWRATLVRGRAIEKLLSLPMPEEIFVKVPEGYASYAVYSEMYALAAGELGSAPGSLCVIGIRSIGTSLASIVAAAARCDRLPFTVLRETDVAFRSERCPASEDAQSYRRSAPWS